MPGALIATGSRGDVQPYIARRKGLTGAGHRFRLVTHEDFETLAMQERLEKGDIAGWLACLQTEELPENVFLGDSIPHDRLPRSGRPSQMI